MSSILSLFKRKLRKAFKPKLLKLFFESFGGGVKSREKKPNIALDLCTKIDTYYI
jgi:hypothetical protein